MLPVPTMLCRAFREHSEHFSSRWSLLSAGSTFLLDTGSLSSWITFLSPVCAKLTNLSSQPGRSTEHVRSLHVFLMIYTASYYCGVGILYSFYVIFQFYLPVGQRWYTQILGAKFTTTLSHLMVFILILTDITITFLWGLIAYTVPVLLIVGFQ